MRPPGLNRRPLPRASAESQDCKRQRCCDTPDSVIQKKAVRKTSGTLEGSYSKRPRCLAAVKVRSEKVVGKTCAAPQWNLFEMSYCLLQQLDRQHKKDKAAAILLYKVVQGGE
jgi:hypothetical protein